MFQNPIIRIAASTDTTLTISLFQLKIVSMWIHRDISKELRDVAKTFPVVVLVGPRQVGKTSMTDTDTIKLNPVTLNQGRQIKIGVSPVFHEKRLQDMILAFSPQSASSLIERGLFSSQTSVLGPDDMLKKGQVIIFEKPPWREPVVPDHIPLIFQDDSLLVVDKPPGIPVTPTGDYYCNSLVNQLRSTLGMPDLSPIHRLDLETSGVLIFSKVANERSFLQRQFQDHRVEKRYDAMVFGHMDHEMKELHGFYRKGGDSRIFSKWMPSAGGKECRTRVLSVKHWREFSLLELMPLTGRTNQLRAQLAAIGHPIVGDKKYFFDEDVYLEWVAYRDISRIIRQTVLSTHALHARSVIIEHPVKGERMQFQTSSLRIETRYEF